MRLPVSNEMRMTCRFLPPETLPGNAMNRTFIATLVLAVALGASAQAPANRWVLADEYPATSLPGEGDTFFAKAVAGKAGGALAIETQHDAKSGFKSREQLKAVAEGKVAMANNFAGALGDEDAFFLLSSLPFLAANAGEARRLYELAKPRYEAVLKAHNQKLLFSTPWPPSGVWAKVAADTPEAVAALKIRTYDKTGTELFKALGATASVVSFTDLPAMLHASVIDAVLSSGDGGAGRKLWEVLPNFTEINYAVPLSLATVNLDRWNALDAATQKAVLEAAAETEARQWQAMEGRVAKNYERMRENGMTITTKVTPALAAKFKEAAGAVILDWEAKSGAEGRDVLERFRKGAVK
jgi:TRAP-type C4-dicarboxylate transport system substrate-binding protein